MTYKILEGMMDELVIIQKKHELPQVKKNNFNNEMEKQADYEDELGDTEEDTESSDKTKTPFVYSFCHDDSEYQNYKKTINSYTNIKLLDILKISSDRTNNRLTVKDNRRMVRVACSIVLNERGVAPEFRDAKSGVTHKASDSIEEMQESNDRQLIDMHWLYLHHQSDIKPTEWMRDFFTKSDFDYEEAVQFVANARDTKIKIKRIGIPEDVQKLLLSLRTQSTLKFQKLKRLEVEDSRLALINRSRTPSSRLNQDDLEQNLAAFRCLLYAELSVVKAMEYWQTLSTDLTSKVTQQLKPWMKGRLQLLKKIQDLQSKVKI